MVTTDIAEAREAHRYWSRRAATLPWHRRAARREARVLAARWRGRLAGAYLDRVGLGSLARFVAPVVDTGGRRRSSHVGALALAGLRRSAIGRKLIFAASVATLLAVVSVAFVAALAIQLV
jgi:hypothetical protein